MLLIGITKNIFLRWQSRRSGSRDRKTSRDVSRMRFQLGTIFRRYVTLPTIQSKTCSVCQLYWELLQNSLTNRCSNSLSIYSSQHTVLMLWLQSLQRKYIVSPVLGTSRHTKLSRTNVLPVPSIFRKSTWHSLVCEHTSIDCSCSEKQYSDLAYWLDFRYLPGLSSMDSTDRVTRSDSPCYCLYLTYRPAG